MTYIYIIDINGNTYGAFDSVDNALKFGNTLNIQFKLA